MFFRVVLTGKCLGKMIIKKRILGLISLFDLVFIEWILRVDGNEEGPVI